MHLIISAQFTPAIPLQVNVKLYESTYFTFQLTAYNELDSTKSLLSMGGRIP